MKYFIISLFFILLRCSTNTENEQQYNTPIIDSLKAEIGYSDFDEKAHFATDQTISIVKKYIIDSLRRDPNEYLYTAFFDTIDNDTLYNTMTIYDKKSLEFSSEKNATNLIKL